VNSDWDVVPYQKNQERTSPEVNTGAILFMVKQCSHYEEILGMVSRYLVSIVNTCRPRTL